MIHASATNNLRRRPDKRINKDRIKANSKEIKQNKKDSKALSRMLDVAAQKDKKELSKPRPSAVLEYKDNNPKTMVV